MRGRRPEADPRFTPHVSRFLDAGRERRRWPRIIRRSRTVNVGQAPNMPSDTSLADFEAHVFCSWSQKAQVVNVPAANPSPDYS
jgi:hypothetical protein